MLKNFNTLAGRTNRPIKSTYFIYECDNYHYKILMRSPKQVNVFVTLMYEISQFDRTVSPSCEGVKVL